jgi:hypothetical protein
MNLRNIEFYVERKNAFAKLFGNKELSLLDGKDRQRIAEMIDCDLSPENLTCDGEIPSSEVSRRYNFLNRCARELQSIDPSVKFYEYN